MHYFFYSTDQQELPKEITISTKTHSLLYHQLRNVLKFKTNDQLCLLNNSNFEYIYKIKNIDKKNFFLKLEKKQKNQHNLNVHINLVIANPKKTKLEFITQKAAELGIKEITPILSDHTIKKNINLKRLNKINKEAVEQSHGSKLMKINKIQELNKNFINQFSKNTLNIILHTKSTKTFKNLENTIPQYQKINLFIGPEGGFTKEDLNILQQLPNNYTILLNKRILRLETAALLSMGLLTHYIK